MLGYHLVEQRAFGVDNDVAASSLVYRDMTMLLHLEESMFCQAARLGAHDYDEFIASGTKPMHLMKALVESGL